MPRRETAVRALCGIAIHPLAPTTELQDQLARIRCGKCADKELSAHGSGFFDGDSFPLTDDWMYDGGDAAPGHYGGGS
jgi:hypothetical protein